jgi:hypothetical protein
MNASINALRGSILGATEDVVLVKSIANETYAKLKEMGIFFHLGGIIMSRWGWLVVILIGVAMASRRAAGFIAISAGQQQRRRRQRQQLISASRHRLSTTNGFKL